MKRLLLLFPAVSILALFFTATAQVRIKSVYLTNPDSSVLYIGIPNLIEVSGTNSTSLRLTSSRSTITKSEGNQYMVTCSSIGSETIRVFANKKLVLEKKFRIARIPDPRIFIGSIETRQATVEEILSNPTLSAFPLSFLSKHFLHVKEFSGLLIRATGDTLYHFANKSNRFSEADIEQIKTMKGGDVLIIEEALIGGPIEPSHTRWRGEPILIKD